MEEGVAHPNTKEELKEALSKYERRALDLVTTEAQEGIWYKMLGTRYLDEKMYGQAMESFKKALTFYPDNANLYYYIAVCAVYVAHGQAFDLANVAGTIDSEKKEEYLRMSEAAYTQALNINPDYYRALYGIGVLYTFELTEDSAKAIPYMERFLQTQTNSITLTGLDPLSEYVVWVRKLCTDDTSLTSDAFHFVTEMCDNPTFAYNYDSTMTSTTTSQYAPIGYSTYNYSYVQTIIDSAFMAEMQGDITAFAFNVSTASAGDYFTGMNVYMANVSESSLSGFITPDSAHQFVEVIHNGDFTFTTTGWQLFGFDSTFTWDGHSNVLFAVNRNHGSWSSGAYFHAHNTTGASKTYYAYQDSGPISITSPSADYGNTTLAYTGDIMLVSCGGGCRVPGAVSFNNVTYNAATANWSGSATDYEVSVKAANEAIWPEATPVTGNTFAISNLAPATQYQFRVRAICDATENLISDWTMGTFTTDSLPCFEPSNIHTEDIGYTTATLAWTAAEGQNQWSIHVWNSVRDTDYVANANPFTITGLRDSTRYFATVKAICGNGATESGYSDTVEFITGTCAQVTDVNVTNLQAHSATINWSSLGVDTYEIEYGNQNFSQGYGTKIVVNGGATTYNLTGLTDDHTYSVFVRAKCEDNVYGKWSTKVDFTTPEGDGITTADGTNLSIFPNPTSNVTTVSVNGVNGEVSITIVDMNGRTVI